MAEVGCSGVPTEAQRRAEVAGGRGGEPLPGLPAGVLLDGAPAPLQVSACNPLALSTSSMQEVIYVDETLSAVTV